MLNQRQIRKATRDKLAGIRKDVARQNLLAEHAAEVAAFALDGVDVSHLQAGRQ